MTKVIEAMKAWFALFPLIISAVRAIEEQIKESGMGAAKLAAVRLAIEAVYDTCVEAVQVLGPLAVAWPRIEKFIKALVESFNVRGIFRKNKDEAEQPQIDLRHLGS